MFICSVLTVPDPQSVAVTSSGNIVPSGSTVSLMCTVVLNSAILESELSLLMVDAQLSRDGTLLTLTGPLVTGTAYTFTATVDFFSESDAGNYTCSATVSPQPSSQHLTGTGQLQSSSYEITIGTCKWTNCLHYCILVMSTCSPVAVEPTTTIATEATTEQPIESEQLHAWCSCMCVWLSLPSNKFLHVYANSYEYRWS